MVAAMVVALASYACMVQGGDIGGVGRGRLEDPRQWQSARWAGLSPWEYALRPEPPESHQARPEEAQEARWGPAKRALSPCCAARRREEA
eukprot:scaffold8043_cov61-Phaeocystis_antarctica.AAC.6